MLTRGSSNKVLYLLFLTQWAWIYQCTILFVQINVLPTVSKSSHTAGTVRDEDRITVKEETSFCSVSLLLSFHYVSEHNYFYFALRMVVLTLNYSLEQLQTSMPWISWMPFSPTMRWGDIFFSNQPNRNQQENCYLRTVWRNYWVCYVRNMSLEYWCTCKACFFRN